MTEHCWDRVADEVNFNLEIDIRRFINVVSKDSKILDFGCGYGRISNELASYGYSAIHGVDSSLKMIERGIQDYPKLLLQNISGQELPYPDECFDAVISCAVFTCITSPEQRISQINELYRVLKPSGTLHLVEFCSEVSRTFTSGIGITMCHSTPEELRQLVNGFSPNNEEVIETTTMSNDQAQCYSLFAKKPLNKKQHRTLR